MEQEKMFATIIDKLNELKLVFTKSNHYGVIIDTQLFKKALFGSKREIHYQAVLSVKEKDKTIYFWESTSDVKKGFSFGVESESYTQSGTSLHRKVFSKQTDIKGKSYDFEFDLGALGQFLKDLAKANGYAFKVVFKKEKAL